MNIVFAGTPEFSATILSTLISGPHDIVGVLSQPDKPKGRGQHLVPTPVKTLALEHQIPVSQPVTLRTPEAQKIIADWQPDLMVVVAFGLLLPQAVLNIPRLGCMNIHVSLLPRWRGSSPMQRALLAADSETGITFMKMDAGMDTGPVLSQYVHQIAETETFLQLEDNLCKLAQQHLLKTIDDYATGVIQPQPQSTLGITLAPKLAKEDGLLDFARPARLLAKQIAGLNPWPGTYFEHKGQKIKVIQAIAEEGMSSPGTILAYDAKGLQVGTSTGILRILQIQLPNKSICTVSALKNGHPQLFIPSTLI